MKKIVCFIISIIIAISFSLTPIYANDINVLSLEDIDIVESISEFDEETYGGVYYENGIFHFIPVENIKSNQLYDLTKKRSSSQIHIDNQVKYTLSDLKEASNNVFNMCDILDIVSTSVDIKNNSIVVGDKNNWTDEKKEKVRTIAQIDNIEYIVDDIEFSNGIKTPATDINIEQKTSRTNEFYIGDFISDGDWNSTLGGCIKIGNKQGYLTSGHNNYVGQKFYLNGSYYMGKTSKVTYSGNLDAAFIERDSSSLYGMTNKVRLSKDLSRTGTVTSAGTPEVAGLTFIYGSAGGLRYAVVETINYNYKINGTNFTNLIRFDVTGSDGDSGSPVLMSLGNDKYKLVGIWKGINGSGKGIATRWDKIASEWGATIY